MFGTVGGQPRVFSLEAPAVEVWMDPRGLALSRRDEVTFVPIAALTHDGESNFVVFEETGDAFSMGLLVNEIGPYSGTVPLSAGPSLISISADGAWTAVVG